MLCSRYVFVRGLPALLAIVECLLLSLPHKIIIIKWTKMRQIGIPCNALSTENEACQCSTS